MKNENNENVDAQRALTRCLARARLLIDERRLAQARDILREGAILLPDQAELYNALGHVLTQMKDYEAAAAAYRQRAHLTPSMVTWQELGRALLLQGDQERNDRDARARLYNEAVTAFKEAVRLSPWYPKAHYHLGSALIRCNDFEAALIAYTEATKLDPAFAAAFSGQAFVHFCQGHLTRCTDAYKTAITLRPGDSSAHHGLGCALLKTGRIEEALVSFQEAARLTPGSGKYLRSLGDALEQVGDLKAAASARRRADQITEPSQPSRRLLPP